MIILGIETSCDETAAAVVENGTRVHSNIIASSADLHSKTGGVVPEVAAREHLKAMMPVVHQALKEAGLEFDQVDSVAVTTRPGLIASLLVGIHTAQTLAYVHQKPLIEVDHIAGHIYANFLDRSESPEFPLLVLTVSGGHNELVLMRGHHDFEVLGRTRDDAAGEAFDKIARVLGLGFPGGPVISCRAEQGNPETFHFPRTQLADSYDFSFSGLKSAVLRTVRSLESKGPLTEAVVNDLAASFQAAVVDQLVNRIFQAAEVFPIKAVHLAGGVSANRLLRQEAREKLPSSLPLFWPAKGIYCTDNAAMIAGAAYFMRQS